MSEAGERVVERVELQWREQHPKRCEKGGSGPIVHCEYHHAESGRLSEESARRKVGVER